MERQARGGHTLRDLVAWQKAMSAAEEVYRLTKSFPPDERFGLTIQCRRAAMSIAANIAEGHGRESPPYFAQFLRIAQGSAVELDTELELANRLGYLDDAAWASIHERLDHIMRLIWKLRRAITKP
ncbi:MAG: four helix bundle protein [Gemmatimonadales bacterium]